MLCNITICRPDWINKCHWNYRIIWVFLKHEQWQFSFRFQKVRLKFYIHDNIRCNHQIFKLKKELVKRWARWTFSFVIPVKRKKLPSNFFKLFCNSLNICEICKKGKSELKFYFLPFFDLFFVSYTPGAVKVDESDTDNICYFTKDQERKHWAIGIIQTNC